MTKKTSNTGNRINPKTGKPVPHRSDPKWNVEAAYGFFRTAGGITKQAWTDAIAVGQKGVPKDREAWYRLVLDNDFKTRLAKETAEDMKEYHNAREAKKQNMLDKAAAAIEPLIEAYGDLLGKAMKALLEKDNAHLAILRKDFAFGPESFDKMFRLYLRAVGLPEKITHSSHDMRTTTILTYPDLEDIKKGSRGKDGRVVITAPKSVKEAREMVKTIHLTGAWADPDPEDEE